MDGPSRRAKQHENDCLSHEASLSTMEKRSSAARQGDSGKPRSLRTIFVPRTIDTIL
jgi:hypothetical protein